MKLSETMFNLTRNFPKLLLTKNQIKL